MQQTDNSIQKGGHSSSPFLVEAQAALHQEIEGLVVEHGAEAARSEILGVLKRFYHEARETIGTWLKENPKAARQVIRLYSDLTDIIVKEIFHYITNDLFPNNNPSEGEKLSILAVGGYGRAEMAPFSDVDLTFITPYKKTPWTETVIEAGLYLLWDLRLKVGYATRSVDECVRLANEDLTIKTALLEHRFLCGDEALAETLKTRLWEELFATTGPEFVEAKLEERAERHKKHGGTRYLVEPNIKEGKGGLRDLQTLYWIAKYLNRVVTSADMIKAGVFDQEEFLIFDEAEAFLWRVRCLAHLITNRAQEQLTFDLQVEIAAALGYHDHDGRRGVEYFMQDYFIHAKSVGDLTRVFLTALEAKHVRKRVSVRNTVKHAFSRFTSRLTPVFTIHNERIDIANEEEFLKDPRNILRIFQDGVKTGVLLHPEAMRVIARNLDYISGDFIHDPEANEIFIDSLLNHGNPERLLRRMNELGVLGAFIPEFGEIVCMMQFNMYHSYTVDEHTIQCISVLSEIEGGAHVQDLPIASEIIKEGVDRKVLYVALLLHDIGKGRPEDHSILGAKIAQQVAPRFGLDKDQVETVVWLVRNHLLMSDVAQKRDLSDPKTAIEFVKEVKTLERLNLLLVLTVCDINGVGPNVWNNWKAMLLRELHAQSVSLITGDHSADLANRVKEAQAELAEQLGDWSAEALDHELNRHYPAYWLGNDKITHKVFAKLLYGLQADEIRSSIEQDEARDASRACFVLQDHPGIFSRLAGALALSGANVVEARTDTSADGFATAVFWVQDSDGTPYDTTRLARLRKMVDQSLKGEVITRDLIRDRRKIKKREQAFRVPTKVTFDNEGSDIYTIIEVDTRDRLGLLHDITRTLSMLHISIASAVVATYGEQAVDAFYVKDLFGLKIYSQSKQEKIKNRLLEITDNHQDLDHQ